MVASKVGTLNVVQWQYKYLGESFDIHGGGQDLIFPHHENEIQSRCAYNGEFAKYWCIMVMSQLNGEK